MGRWMQKIQKSADAIPTEPTKPGYVGFVGAPSARFEKNSPTLEDLSPQQIGWLAAVASLLEIGTGHLLEGEFIDADDLVEQTGADPRNVASLIRSGPGWARR